MEEKKLSTRDMTLVNVLERLADQIKQYNARLEEIEKNQFKLSSAFENTKTRQNSRQDDISTAIERLEYSFTRYRTDIFNLVNEQDHISSYMKDMATRQSTMAGAQEIITQNLAGLYERYALQEKMVHEHSVYSVQQREALSKELTDVNNHISKLHIDTEKRLMEQYQETQLQMQELRLEIMRRLLAFDGIESALSILLSRTEPPPPKELPKVIRLLYNGIIFIRAKLSGLLRRVSGWLRIRFGKIE